ncbi:RNA ligase RtcB family protein [Bosea sp. BK604]|uniref:RNA ligase RtcB family protein n=1 Tax=Bosea sp. BK604 TaxID=2512180 RepID=UPI00104D1A5F|nr:RNA ligase RtcB family protein [Bosea sp. BK604]TCR68797.1 release factor H-coupled RctB family protein [Bosea sp. BK604]
MGNPLTADGAAARIRIYASSNAWIEGAAIAQLEHLAARPDVLAVAGLPDLHPGHHGPVGCAALVAGRVFPDVIGTDIGCGMQLHVLDLPERRLKLDKAVERMAALEGPWDGDATGLLAAQGIDGGEFTASLGTVGGGNHFCELQGVEEIVDPSVAGAVGLERGGLALLVHSGSRGLGAATLARHYHDGTHGLTLGEGGEDYLADHDNALRFARLNRQVIAGRALAALRSEAVELLDSPHNLAERHGDNVLHRKGAAPVDRGLVPVPGSRGAVTYLVQPLPGNPDALGSLAHGAGRKHDRASMQKRLASNASTVARLARNAFGGHVICSDRKLLYEEAPEAYKDVERVVGEMEAAGLCRVVAVLRPLITFKTARQPREASAETPRFARSRKEAWR